jgi:hypothetical protein
MPGKKATPDQNAQAVVLREAGYTLPAIAARLQISVSTAQRLLKKHSVVVGASTHALIEKAREDMMSSAFSLESVQQQAASMVLDDLALSQQIRVKLSLALEALDGDSPLAFRALAASATALKLTQDVGRRALPLEKLNQSMDVDELPELHIRIMTAHDVAEMRAQQRLEEAEISGDTQGIDDEKETLSWLAGRRAIEYEQQNDDDIVSEG